MIQLLLDHGADPNQRPWTGQPCVHLAASQGDINIVQALISKRVNINANPTIGETVLGPAIYRDDADMVHLLLDSDASVSYG